MEICWNQRIYEHSSVMERCLKNTSIAGPPNIFWMKYSINISMWPINVIWACKFAPDAMLVKDIVWCSDYCWFIDYNVGQVVDFKCCLTNDSFGWKIIKRSLFYILKNLVYLFLCNLHQNISLFLRFLVIIILMSSTNVSTIKVKSILGCSLLWLH